MNDIGLRIVENYYNAEVKSPGGLCFGLVADRVDQAYRDIRGQNLTDLFGDAINAMVFENLWKSHCYDPWWLDKSLYPKKWRGKGAPAAMTYAKEGTMVKQADIWKGKLKPGALLQIWDKMRDFERVRDYDITKPDQLESYGHSFIFLEYVYDGDEKITGMKIADQSNRWQHRDTEVFKEKYFEFWVAANLTRGLPEGSNCEDQQGVRELLANIYSFDAERAVNYNVAYNRNTYNLDAGKIADLVKEKTPNSFYPSRHREALKGIETAHFNLYFAWLTALYQITAGLTVDGKFGDYTCRRLTGQTRAEAEEFKMPAEDND